MPAWIIAGAPSSAAVVVAASRPAHRRRTRPDISGSFHGGHLPPPLLRYDHRARIISPPRPLRRLVMIKRRLTKTVLSAGVAGGLLFAAAGTGVLTTHFPQLGGVKENNRTDVVLAAGVPGGGKSFVGPADDPFFVDLGAIFDGVNL